ncbi:MAG: TonB-dependent receptor [Chromatiales bacterium]|nr:TonB-dependent receptor [Chromatiales bacterium]
MKTQTLRAATAGLAATSLLAALPAHAQLEEIVVTAKLREQRLQEVPLSIAVLSDAELDRARITELRALAEFTPNLVFTAGLGRESPSTLAIRGVAPNTGDIRLQGVSVFLDGVYVGGAVQSLDLTQLQRVEVLRGPQSSTFGRQTYAGALNYVTRTPQTDEITGTARLSFSSNRGSAADNWQIGGNVQMPVIQDGMWLELGATKKTLGEMSRNGSRVARNTPNEFFREVKVGREETTSFTGGLLIEPVENLSIRLRGIISRDRDGPPLVVALHPQEWQAKGLNVVERGGGLLWPNDTLFGVSFDAASCDSAAGRPGDCGVDRNREFFSSNITYNLNGYELSYVAGWASDQRWSNTDLYLRGASPDPFFGDVYTRSFQGDLVDNKAAPFFSAQNQRYENQSHELRILSPDEGMVTWRAGLYYFAERERFGVAALQSPTNPRGIFRGPQRVKNYAIFGGALVELNEQFSVELEGRLQREEDFLGVCPAGACSGPNVRDFTTTEKNNEFLPRVTLMYRPTEDAMLYALFSQGTKSGRFNTNQATNFLYVDPEKLTNYELGAKTEWLDGRLVLNGAAFLIKIKDQQFSTVALIDNVPQTAFQNIGRSEVKGFELDGRLLITESWSAAAGIAYSRQKYTNDFLPTDANLIRLFTPAGAAGPEGFKGKSSMSLPEWTGFLSTQYVQPVAAGTDLVLDGSITYRGSAYADQANLSEVPAITRVNLRAALDSERWEIALFVSDLFSNDKPIAGLTNPTNTCLYFARDDGPDFTPVQRCIGVVLDRGREVGANLTFRF